MHVLLPLDYWTRVYPSQQEVQSDYDSVLHPAQIELHIGVDPFVGSNPACPLESIEYPKKSYVVTSKELNEVVGTMKPPKVIETKLLALTHSKTNR